MNGAKLLGTAILAVFDVWALYAVVPTYAMKLWQRFARRGRHADAHALCLTFDDGPSPRYTDQLLTLLKREQIQATFFVVARFAEQNPAIIARMQEEGHEIGLHSLSHQNGLFMSPRGQYRDLKESTRTLQNLGVSPRWSRPPWGHFNLATFVAMRRLGLRPFLWDVMAQDWSAHQTKDGIVAALNRRTFNGATICLHDGRGSNEAPARTLNALGEMLPRWKEQGYHFETASSYALN